MALRRVCDILPRVVEKDTNALSGGEDRFIVDVGEPRTGAETCKHGTGPCNSGVDGAAGVLGFWTLRLFLASPLGGGVELAEAVPARSSR